MQSKTKNPNQRDSDQTAQCSVSNDARRPVKEAAFCSKPSNQLDSVKVSRKDEDCASVKTMNQIETVRFGRLDISEEEIITIPEGILGFPELTKYCLVDPGDDTLILWLQSLENSNISFPVLEPKIFKTDYIARLSAQELKVLKLENINQSIVFTILTIPRDVSQMTANLKAPLVINLKEQIGRQIVLQENEYTLKYLMFRELKAHLTTIEATKNKQNSESRKAASLPINLRSMVPSSQVRSL